MTDTYSPVDKELEDYNFTTKRISKLMKSRDNVEGRNITDIWRRADRDYEPHSLRGSRKVDNLRTDRRVVLSENDWQVDNSQPNPFIKVQTAIALLFDQNPTAILRPRTKKYAATTALMKALYENNWEQAKSDIQLHKFIMNLGKYGFAIGRTYHRYRAREIHELEEYDPTTDLRKYKKRDMVEYDDVFRESLNPYDCFIDEGAVPGDMLSVRDWVHVKDYDKESLKNEFQDFKNWKFIDEEGAERYRVFFYENQQIDAYRVLAVPVGDEMNQLEEIVYPGGVMLVNEPLPYAHKRVSLWFAWWNLRSTQTIYGIGLPEMMRQDQNFLDRVRNMNADQLLLSIYKMWFYSGTDQVGSEGQLVIKPGKGQMVLDPKAITFLDVPGPSQAAVNTIEQTKKDIDDVTGVIPTLMGEVTGKTKFEVGLAREAALRRLRNPLFSIQQALEVDASLTIDLMKQIYSEPEVEHIADPKEIINYLDEVENNPDLHFIQDGEFYANKYREFWLPVKQDEKGEFTPSREKDFFRATPEFIRWEGEVKIQGESILRPSKELERQNKLELANLLIPLLGQPPEMVSKPARRLLEINDEDPDEWLPDAWLDKGELAEKAEVGAVPKQALQQPEAETVVPESDIGQAQQPGPLRRAFNKINPFS